LLAVLDASALLALLKGETGQERVEAALKNAAICTVNITETMTNLIDSGADSETLGALIRETRLMVVDFDYDLAVDAAALRDLTRARGLSLGDRACLALAKRLGGVALTADRAWADVDAGVEVELIR
jgi:PIN domain nuclease of toxin-antitoxin system